MQFQLRRPFFRHGVIPESRISTHIHPQGHILFPRTPVFVLELSVFQSTQQCTSNDMLVTARGLLVLYESRALPLASV